MSMKYKRLLAAFLAVSMLLPILPPPSIMADSDVVEYTREKPEVAILNRHTGSSDKFYETLLADGNRFNAIGLFGKKPSDKIAETTLSYNGFAPSVLNHLSFVRDNLKVNVSGTFHNNFHKHSYGFLGLGRQDVLAASTLKLGVKGDSTNPILRGHSRPTEANARLGNMQYMPVNALDYRFYYGGPGQPAGLGPNPQYDMKYGHSMTMKLEFDRNIFFDKDGKQCTCGGHYVTKTVVAFKDERAPILQKVTLRKNDEDAEMSEGYFGEGDTIKIELLYDEFIRFADDSNSHADLSVKLKIEAKDPSSYPEAKLKKLDTDTLYFEYKVPETAGQFMKITGLDLSPLMGDQLPLKQVDKDNFTVTVPTDASGSTGFTTSTAYITDLAGNAIIEKSASYKAYIDTRDLKVENIKISFNANNQDVKDALGKTDPDNQEYYDKSDNYMGVGDSILVALVMNKKLELSLSKPGSIYYSGLVAHTNWAYADGTPCITEAQWITPVSNVEGEEVTDIALRPITVLPGMYCVDGVDRPLKITELVFKENVEPFKDIAGNKYDANSDLSDIPMPACYLDTQAPKITTTANLLGEEVYEVIPVTGDARVRTFEFPFMVDEDDVSGIEDLKGGFCWQMHGEPVAFEYMVTADASLAGNQPWQSGETGKFYEFTQTGTDQYVFIRPAENREYHIYDTEILFYAKDYAGNSHLREQPVRFKLDVAWDDVPPTIKAGNVERSPNSGELGGGWKLDVAILLQDHTALDDTSVYYAWIDAPPNPDTGEISGQADWKLAPVVPGPDAPRSGTATATVNVDAGTRFSKHLMVKAKDTSKNESVAYLGKYEYDLTAITYALGYSSGITSEASLRIEKIEENGALLFMIPTPESDKPNEYFVAFYKVNEPENEIYEPGTRDPFSQALSGFTTGWTRLEVEKESWGYSFTKVEDWYETEYMEAIIMDDKRTFSGNLPVTILAGPQDAFGTEILEHYGTIHGPYPVSATSVVVEEILLRVSSLKSEATDAFTGMSIEPVGKIDTKYDPGFWEKEQLPMLSTAEGVAFQVNLGTDVHGWHFEDVDYAASYVELEYKGETGHDQSGESYKVYLSPSPVQTVVFPTGDYPTGYYDVILEVVCKAGKDYTVTLKKAMYIDDTPAVQNFGITSLTYAEKGYQHAAPWHDVDGSINYYSGSEVIYLPVNSSNGSYKNDLVENVMKIELEQTAGIPLPLTYAVRAWNATAGARAEGAAYSTTNIEGNPSFMLTVWDDAAGAAADTGTIDTSDRTNIGLIKNKPNTIAVQVLNANGKESAIHYYVIYPVDEAVGGTVSFTRGEQGSNVVSVGNLIFKPEAGQSMEGAGVYVSVGYYEHSGGTHHLKEKVKGQEMLPQADGTYTYPLLPGKEDSKWYYVYSVYTIDSYGNLTMFEDLSSAVVDQEAPFITALPDSSSSGGGLYEAKFKVEDESLYAASLLETGAWSGERVYMPLKINLRFDKEHAEWLGIHESTSLDLTLNKNEQEFVWKATENSPTGIYEVRAARKKDEGPDYANTPHWLEVTVKGVVGHKEEESPQTFSLIMDATDAFGNTTKASAEYETEGNLYSFIKFSEATVARPAAITEGVGAPEYVATAVAHDYALKINFNSPVLPATSWIRPQPEYGMEQIDAFPITEDGSWTISFADIFGNVHQQELQLKDVFKERGLTLGLDPLELTTEAVNLLVRTVERDAEGAVLIFRKTQDGSMETIKDVNGNLNTPMLEKAVTADSNQTLLVMHYPKLYSHEDLFQNGYYKHGDRLEININNICQGAPEAKAHFYFDANGTEYTLDNLDTLLTRETPGDVRVWYSTSRNVIPTDDTGSSYTFKQGGKTSHTFTYRDDFDNTGSLSVDLAALGINLIEAPDPAADNTPPLVMVALNAKRFGTYREVEAFGDYSKADDIKDSFEAASYVQGYLLVVNVDDQSSYKIVVKKNAPTSLTYAEATSDDIPGISLVGNTIAISEAADFSIAVVDNAKAETPATADNFTCLNLKATDMAAWFDNTTPEAVIKEKWETLYQKNIYISLSDKADKGQDTGYVTLDSPKLDKETAEGDYLGWYKLVFTRNSSNSLVFYDIAGNMGKKDLAVTTLDDTKPILTTTWSPHYVNPNDPADIALGAPPVGPTNANVTATLVCNTAISQVKAEYSTDNGANWQATAVEQVSYRHTANQIFVTFTGAGRGIRLTVTAPNGQATTETLLLAQGVIDKTVLSINSVVVNQYRPDGKNAPYAVPYAAKITLTPSKPAYCLNAGQQEIADDGSGNKNRPLYDANRPLIVTIYSNESKTYKFVDKAGNHGEVTVITSGLDNTAPILTVNPENTLDLAITSGFVEVNITSNENGTAVCQGKTYTLAADQPQVLSFTENGVYTIAAYDRAGNIDTVSVAVGNIDKVAPRISFDKLTLNIRQDSSDSDLKALLDNEQGITVWDNLDAPDQLTWTYQLIDENGAKQVDLTTPGLYLVTYTVTDKAGNVGEATRYVKVVDKNLPVIVIDDDKLTEPEGTTVLSAGVHVLSVEGLKKISSTMMEPYQLKIRRGLVSEGQMKYYPSTITVAANGEFSISQEGFYTLYITTQSRQSYRTLLYVER